MLNVLHMSLCACICFYHSIWAYQKIIRRAKFLVAIERNLIQETGTGIEVLVIETESIRFRYDRDNTFNLEFPPRFVDFFFNFKSRPLLMTSVTISSVSILIKHIIKECGPMNGLRSV